jgi:hypothetical protein
MKGRELLAEQKAAKAVNPGSHNEEFSWFLASPFWSALT